MCQGFSVDHLAQQPWKAIHEISKECAKKGHQISIVTDSSTASRTTSDLVQITGMGNGSSVFWIRPIIFKLVRRIAPDVIILNSSPLGSSYVPLMAMAGVPVVWYIDCFPWLIDKSESPSQLAILHPILNFFLTHFLIRVASKFVTMIVVPSFYHKAVIVKSGVNETKVHVLPSGLDPSWRDQIEGSDRNVFRGQKGFHESEIVVLYYGPPQHSRGLDRLVRSISHVKEQLKEVRLWILSRSVSSRDISDLRSLVARLNLEERVMIEEGTRETDYLRGCLASCDVAVFPFRVLYSEPPLTVLEAMAAGKPVISTRVGMMGEILDGRGVLVSPRNDDRELGDAILMLGKDSALCKRLGARARAYSNGLPMWQEVAHQLLMLISRALRDRFRASDKSL